MATIPEQLSNILANSQGKPDANLAQDANNLGGLPADDFATKEYVKKYHDTKEAAQKEYIDNQDIEMLKQAKEFANALVRNQDFSNFVKLTDVQALDTKLSGELTSGLSNQKAYTDKEIEKVVNDTNENFENVNEAIGTLNGNMKNLFQSVSDGKSKIAGAITDKGVSTSATDTFDNMASNIRSISTIGGEIPEGYIDTSSATASDSDLLLGKTAFAKGSKIIGSHVCSGLDTSDATATPYDILTGKTAYNSTGKIEGVLSVDESTGAPSYSIGGVEKVYGTKANEIKYYKKPVDSEITLTERVVMRDMYNEKGNLFANYLFDINNDNIVIARNIDTSTAYSDVKKYAISSLGLVQPKSGDSVTSSGHWGFSGFGVSNLNIDKPYFIIMTANVYSTTSRFASIKIYTIPIIITYGTDSFPSEISLDIDNMKTSNDIQTNIPAESVFTRTLDIYDLQSTNDGSRFAIYSNYWSSTSRYSDILFFDINSLYYVSYLGGTSLTYSGEKDLFIVDKNTFVFGKNIIIITDNNTVVGIEITGNVKAIFPDARHVLIVDYEIEDLGSEVEYRYKYNYTYYIEDIEIDYIAGTITVSNIHQITNDYLPETSFSTISSSSIMIKQVIAISNNVIIFSLQSTDLPSGLYCFSVEFNTYKLEFFKKDLTIFFDSTNFYSKVATISSSEHRLYQNNFKNSNSIRCFYVEKDFSQVIALKYDGELYYKNIVQNLSATANDVREGKTFIGFNGQPETGTMVVETTETGGATNE